MIVGLTSSSGSHRLAERADIGCHSFYALARAGQRGGHCKQPVMLDTQLQCRAIRGRIEPVAGALQAMLVVEQEIVEHSLDGVGALAQRAFPSIEGRGTAHALGRALETLADNGQTTAHAVEAITSGRNVAAQLGGARNNHLG